MYALISFDKNTNLNISNSNSFGNTINNFLQLVSKKVCQIFILHLFTYKFQFPLMFSKMYRLISFKNLNLHTDLVPGINIGNGV